MWCCLCGAAHLVLHVGAACCLCSAAYVLLHMGSLLWQCLLLWVLPLPGCWLGWVRRPLL